MSLSIKAVSHVINIFAVRAHPRRPHVIGTHSTARIQTSTYSPELWSAVQMRTTTMWTLATMPFTTKLPTITTQASKQLSPLSSRWAINPLKPELNPICYLLALLAHHFLHVSRIKVKSLTLRSLTLYIYGAPILDVSRSHTTTQHSR